MPRRPLRPCAHGRCGTLVESGRCERHAREQQQRADERRGSSTERGYDGRWRRYSLAYRRAHPLCFYCGLAGRVFPAECVDHAIPPSRGGSFDDPENHRPACLACNSAKGDRTEAEYLAGIGLSRDRQHADE